MKDSLRFPLVLSLVCLGAAVGVGGVYTVTKAPIAERKKLEEKEAVQAVAPAGVVNTVALDSTGEIVKATDADGKLLGYVSKGEARGYAGPVVVMVGFDPELHVTGVVVTSQSETPGLGAELGKTTSSQTVWGLLGLDKTEVKRMSWLDQFKGLPGQDTAPAAKKYDAKTGATVTSNAIANGIHRAWERLDQCLKGNPS